MVPDVTKCEAVCIVLVLVGAISLSSADNDVQQCTTATLECFKPLLSALGIQYNNVNDLMNMQTKLAHMTWDDMCSKIKDVDFDQMETCYSTEFEKCTTHIKNSGVDVTYMYDVAKKQISAMKYICTEDCKDLIEGAKNMASCAQKLSEGGATNPTQLNDVQKAEKCEVIKAAVSCMWTTAGACKYLQTSVEAFVTIMQKTTAPLLKPVTCHLPTSSSQSGMRTAVPLCWTLIAAWIFKIIGSFYLY